MGLWRYRKRRRVRFKYIISVIILLILASWLIDQTWPEGGRISISGDVTKIRLYDHLAGKVTELGLEEYVVGVVAAEMPASFGLEALKAQAVAARTYAVKRLQVPDPRVKEINQNADISSDHNINQAWISDIEMQKRWGKWNYATNKKKIIQAVQETAGKVAIYGGQLIDPAYHASCGGNGTENSGDVWKYEVPYLRRVQCNNHPSANHEAVSAMSIQDFSAKMDVAVKAIPASKLFGYSKALQVKEKTSSGRLKLLTFGGKTFTGSELRSKVGLKSTLVEWKIEGSIIKLMTRGYGHGVGMCQHGAGALAGEGRTYEQILKHYYQGTSLANLK